MKKALIIAIVGSFALLPVLCSAQKSTKKIAKTACKCMEEKPPVESEMKQCLVAAFIFLNLE